MMGDKRNGNLIRNLIGRKASEYVVRQVERAHSGGETVFPMIARDLFATSSVDFKYFADVVVWTIRVLPDNAKSWMEALFTEFRQIRYRNNDYVIAMMVSLLQAAAALRSVPSNCTEDGREFGKAFPKWWAELIGYGKAVGLEEKNRKSVASAVEEFLKRSCVVGFEVCDTMLAVTGADGHMWRKGTLSEFVIRQVGCVMMSRVYDEKEVIFALSQYREFRKRRGF